MVHRKLNRTAAHRASLLRNLVTNVLLNESIVTTLAKAKEARTAVERVITRTCRAADKFEKTGDKGQRNALVLPYVFRPGKVLPKLFGELNQRYSSFKGGYTRILRLENRLGDNAPQAILELIGGRRDMRMAMTARAMARAKAQGAKPAPLTLLNVQKVCRNDKSRRDFENLVGKMQDTFYKTPAQLGAVPRLPTYKPHRRGPIRFVENPLNRQSSST